MSDRISGMTGRVRIKICGITRVGDGVAAAAAGADAIGFVFWRNSPRVVDVRRAAEIASELGPFVSTVGLFVNPDGSEVHTVLDTVPISVLQFHGSEPAGFCAAFGKPWIKAIHATDPQRFEQQMQEYKKATGLLLDNYDPLRVGGTGERFDWSNIPAARPRPLILAGGLNAGNVAGAVETVRPWGVDVSSGVESAPGIKDKQKIIAFVEAVYSISNASQLGSVKDELAG